jgi:hypothetical protein
MWEDRWETKKITYYSLPMSVATTPMVLVATWRDGLFVVGETIDQELRNQSVRALAPDGRGGTLAIVNGRSLRRRAPDGVWSTIATTELDLACCVAVGDVIYVGSDDARVLRVGADGELEQLRAFDAVAGRDTWYAGSALINGQRVGPPLGIRSITATPDRAVIGTGGNLPTKGRWRRSAGRRRRWPARMDRGHRRHPLHRHARFGSRAR